MPVRDAPDPGSPPPADPPIRRQADLDAGALQRVHTVSSVALLVVMAALWLFQGEDGGPLAMRMFDFYQKAHPRSVRDSPVRVIAVDETSLLNFGAWPWPRNYLVALQEAALRDGALAVGYDFLFSEPDRHGVRRLSQIYQGLDPGILASMARLPDLDAHFADSIASSPVVLARVGTRTDSTGRLSRRLLARQVRVEGPAEILHTYPYAFANLAELDDFASGHGLLNGPPDSDGIVRRLPLLTHTAGDPTPSFALELLRVARGVSRIRFGADGTWVQVADLRIDTEPPTILRPWLSPPLPQRYVSASTVLDGSFPPGTFKDRIVVIAPAALGLEDVVTTPLVAESYGVDVHAQAIETMLSGEWLSRTPELRRAEWLVMVLFGFAAILILPRFSLRQGVALILTAGALLTLFGAFLFVAGRMLFDPTLPIVGATLTAMVVLGKVAEETTRISLELEAQRAQLRERLQETRIAHARVDGELTAAREIQLGIVPDTGRIRNLPAHVRVDAILEPAREVGGDLYDVFMLDTRHLYFQVGDVTGKGIPAAMFMVISKALTSCTVAQRDRGLNEAISEASLRISKENPASLFVTLVAGILDTETGALELVNAGHDDPFLLRPGREPERIRCDGGPPLCFVREFEYPLDRTRLAPGDRLLLLTDGIAEARSPEGALFGNERLVRLLGSLQGACSNREVLERLRETVRAFEGGEEATDDLTALLIEYRPAVAGHTRLAQNLLQRPRHAVGPPD